MSPALCRSHYHHHPATELDRSRPCIWLKDSSGETPLELRIPSTSSRPHQAANHPRHDRLESLSHTATSPPPCLPLPPHVSPELLNYARILHRLSPAILVKNRVDTSLEFSRAAGGGAAIKALITGAIAHHDASAIRTRRRISLVNKALPCAAVMAISEIG